MRLYNIISIFLILLLTGCDNLCDPAGGFYDIGEKGECRERCFALRDARNCSGYFYEWEINETVQECVCEVW